MNYEWLEVWSFVRGVRSLSLDVFIVPRRGIIISLLGIMHLCISYMK